MLKNFAALGLSTLIRLLTGFVLIVLIAREWGATRFGEFMYLFSVATLLVLACEYGFSQQILREVGRDPATAAVRMGRFLAAKVWLTGLAWLIAVAFIFITDLSAENALTLILLLLAGTMMSYVDFLMACFRALNRFSNETVVTLKGNLIYFIFGLAALYAGGGALGVAIAFVVGRLIHLGLTVLEYRSKIIERVPILFHPRNVYPVIVCGAAYGADVAVATAFVNIDTVLVAHMLGFESAGIYQAAARLYQGACLLVVIFGSIYLPRLANAMGDGSRFDRLFCQLGIGLVTTGALLAVVFYLGSFGLHWIYPEPSYQPVAALLPWFGFLVFIRFSASIYGLVVTALGGQSARAMIYVVALGLMVLVAVPLMQFTGVVGMILACTLAYTFLAIAFGVWTYRRGVRVRAWGIAASLGIIIAGVNYWKFGI